ncbi:N-carbamoyl-L-amino acid hydrolase [Aulographum hederae CBS 113979]|uniref:N-carbamoyl-L-amino acid hydrolase n=1 Tax=Aulographum hederae CBS 113979 TaxID=1176131 RepID=A0A6G1HEP2_9PEZI|nr:N-carbamoyl-L-amino acid hydrolase [Aulographum hederae CBS 113979]
MSTTLNSCAGKAIGRFISKPKSFPSDGFPLRPGFHRSGFSVKLQPHRTFSSSRICQTRTSEMSKKDVASLKVSQERLVGDIHHTAQWGTGKSWGDGPTEKGLSRLSLTPSDASVRKWFISTTEALGCTTTVDEMGNIFTVRPGLNNDLPPVYAGSHLDSQPTGGRYDGILGVLAGVEMLRCLNEGWVETEGPVGVVNWTNEEGARFPISMLSSAVWSGTIPLSTAHSLRSVIPASDTATVKSSLESINFLGSTPCSYTATPMAAHFELHIEQGPHLVSSKRKIGIVKGVQSYKWFTITVTGRDCHTGTTSFEHRADALVAASRMIVQSHRSAAGKGALASTGIVKVEPGSTNTVPGTVRFSLDVRAAHDTVVDAVEQELKEDFAAIAAGEDVDGLAAGGVKGIPCEVEWQTDSISPAVDFHEDCIRCVEEASEGLFGTQNLEKLTMKMVSGAGHDSVETSKRVPTSMIFVPCRGGVSHHPAEYCAPEDCAVGAQVLLGSVVGYDRLRAEKVKEGSV